MSTSDVYLETGSKRSFACSLEWPGWCRSGKTEDEALGTLLAYAPRYTVVVAEAGLRFPAQAQRQADVVKHLTGGAGTDFGVPGEIASRDRAPLTSAGAARLAKLVAASWQVLDDVVAGAPARLRKGPRGGGRDRDSIVVHVLEAEAAYARRIGLRVKAPSPADGDAVRTHRDAILAVLRRPTDGTPLAERGWPTRYAARRIAWHALDHAWEIEDKSEPD
jgi:hypothetical protein